MGGDYAPAEVVQGALAVAREDADTEIILVGDENAVDAELTPREDVPANVRVRHAPRAIGMDEHPAQAMRRKRDSSLVLAGQMVKSGEADATFSAGNTGAAMAIATLDIGRIPGIDRPAIATTLPTLKGRALLLDAGANVDCSPQNLLQFALLGAVYAEKALGQSQPDRRAAEHRRRGGQGQRTDQGRLSAAPEQPAQLRRQRRGQGRL